MTKTPRSLRFSWAAPVAGIVSAAVAAGTASGAGLGPLGVAAAAAGFGAVTAGAIGLARRGLLGHGTAVRTLRLVSLVLLLTAGASAALLGPTDAATLVCLGNALIAGLSALAVDRARRREPPVSG